MYGVRNIYHRINTKVWDNSAAASSILYEIEQTYSTLTTYYNILHIWLYNIYMVHIVAFHKYLILVI